MRRRIKIGLMFFLNSVTCMLAVAQEPFLLVAASEDRRTFQTPSEPSPTFRTCRKDLPKNCSIAARCREKLTWLNVSTLPGKTIRCVDAVQKAEVEFQKQRQTLEQMRNVLNERRKARNESILEPAEMAILSGIQQCSVPVFCADGPFWGQFFVRDTVISKVKTRCEYEIKRAKVQLYSLNTEFMRIARAFDEEKKMMINATTPAADGAATTAALTTKIPDSASTSTVTAMPTNAATTMQDSTVDYTTSPTTAPVRSTTDSGPDTTYPIARNVKADSKAYYNGSCIFFSNSTCYWMYPTGLLTATFSMTFPLAEEICLRNASVPAYFPNEIVYQSIIGEMRSKIPPGYEYVNAWTGVTINTTTGIVNYPDEVMYVKWFPGRPIFGAVYKALVNIILTATPDPNSARQGMHNDSPDGRHHGVICQTTI